MIQQFDLSIDTLSPYFFIRDGDKRYADPVFELNISLRGNPAVFSYDIAEIYRRVLERFGGNSGGNPMGDSEEIVSPIISPKQGSQPKFRGNISALIDVSVTMEIKASDTAFLKPWCKVVTGLEGAWSGASLQGDFLRRVASNGKVEFVGKAFPGMPLVAAFTYTAPGTSETQPPSYALCAPVSKSTKVHTDTLEIGGAEVIIAGPFGKVFTEQASPGSHPNAFGAIAKGIEKRLDAFDRPMSEYRRISEAAGVQFTNDTLTFKEQSSIRYNDKTVTLPPGYLFLAEISGIWIIGRQVKSGKQIVLCDALADLTPTLDISLREFIEDQSEKLQALAMAYKVISYAIR